MDAADLVVINTCAIREAAEAKVIGRQGHLARLKAANPGMRVVLTGCSVREPDRAGLAKRFPAVDLFLRPDEEPELVDRLGLASAQAPVGAILGAPPPRRRSSRARHGVGSPRTSYGRAPTRSPAGAVRRGSAISAWLPIIYGCDKTCTYCIVPFSRGPERSRPFDEIVDEARALAAAGYREVTLLGQNVNSYGHDLAPEARFGHVRTERTVGRRQDRGGRPDLAELIRAIDGLRTADGRPAIPRLRFVTSHPWDLSDRLIEAMADCPSVCEALHLPVQSGDDAMLRRMGRQYSIEHYLERLARIREAVPGIAITTDVIVGFCGETEAQFEADAPAARDRPLRPGLRGGVLRAARHARDAPRRRRAGRREAPPARRAAGAPGGDRARAQPGLARRETSRCSSTRSCRRAPTTTTTATTTTAAPGRVTRSPNLPEGVGAPRRPLAGEQARPPRRPGGPAGYARPRGASSTPGRTRSGAARLTGRAGVTARRRWSSSAAPPPPARPGLAIALAERLQRPRHPGRGHLRGLAAGLPGLDIGTAKATAEERARVVHHGLDLVDPTSRSRSPDFAGARAGVLASLAARGGVGILAGGTGFWLRAVAAGIDTDALPSDPAIRAGSRRDLARDGRRGAAARLRRRRTGLAGPHGPREPAPRRPGAGDRRDRRRRAAARPVGYPGPPGLARSSERRSTAAWIGEPGRAQFDAGLIEEARALRERFDPGLPAFSAIGYREAWAVIDGSTTIEAAIAEDARRNVAFAKRQRTWFRAERSLAVVDATGDPAAGCDPGARVHRGHPRLGGRLSGRSGPPRDRRHERGSDRRSAPGARTGAGPTSPAARWWPPRNSTPWMWPPSSPRRRSARRPAAPMGAAVSPGVSVTSSRPAGLTGDDAGRRPRRHRVVWPPGLPGARQPAEPDARLTLGREPQERIRPISAQHQATLNSIQPNAATTALGSA